MMHDSLRWRLARFEFLAYFFFRNENIVTCDIYIFNALVSAYNLSRFSIWMCGYEMKLMSLLLFRVDKKGPKIYTVVVTKINIMNAKKEQWKCCTSSFCAICYLPFRFTQSRFIKRHKIMKLKVAHINYSAQFNK